MNLNCVLYFYDANSDGDNYFLKLYNNIIPVKGQEITIRSGIGDKSILRRAVVTDINLSYYEVGKRSTEAHITCEIKTEKTDDVPKIFINGCNVKVDWEDAPSNIRLFIKADNLEVSYSDGTVYIDELEPLNKK